MPTPSNPATPPYSADTRLPQVVVVGTRGRPEVADAVEAISRTIQGRAQLVAVDLEGELDLSQVEADLLVVCGGDGTVLGAQRRLGHNQIPIVGVNFGKFGFLAAYEFPDFLGDLDQLLLGQFTLRERMRLKCTLRRDGQILFTDTALNDVVISRAQISRMVELEVYINGEFSVRIHGDGLIAASPSGSTAYSLAAGGPLVHPDLHVILVTPICPHTLTMRPLVVDSTHTVRLLLASGTDVAVTVDGQVYHAMQEGDEVTITQAFPNLWVVNPAHHTFFRTLQEKLNWQGHSNLRGLSERLRNIHKP